MSPYTPDIEFAETKSSVLLFVYTSEHAIKLLSSRSLQINEDCVVDLYKEVVAIEKIKETAYCVEIVLTKKEKVRWHNLSGPVKTCCPRVIPNICHNSDTEDCDNVMEVLRRIYANGDEDTRRAMEKSFIESKGTVLSTNWNDVKDDVVSAYELPDIKKGENK